MQKLARKTSEAMLPTKYGNFKVICYEDNNKIQHLVLTGSKNKDGGVTLVRIHSECLTGDALGSLRCDCGPQLEKSLILLGKKGGVLLYLAQEGRGIGLLNKIKSYSMQDKGMDTVQANLRLGFKDDERDYTIAAQILADLGICRIKLLTNNPSKIKGLEKYGVKIVERIPIQITSNVKNKKYLDTKRKKMGHLLK